MPSFDGAFAINPTLRPEHKKYLKRFAEIRHMLWDIEKLETIADPIRNAAGLPLGPDGIYFTGITNVEWDHGRGCHSHPALIDSNERPSLIPNHWCQWISNEEGTALQWDGEEKFYTY